MRGRVKKDSREVLGIWIASTETEDQKERYFRWREELLEGQHEKLAIVGHQDKEKWVKIKLLILCLLGHPDHTELSWYGWIDTLLMPLPLPLALPCPFSAWWCPNMPTSFGRYLPGCTITAIDTEDISWWLSWCAWSQSACGRSNNCPQRYPHLNPQNLWKLTLYGKVTL